MTWVTPALLGSPAITMANHPLFGRAAELARIEAMLDEVEAGRCRALVVEGPAGIGKTHLLDQVVARADARGFEVAARSADWLEQERPFGVVLDALGVTADGSAAIPSLLGSASPASAPVFAVHLPELRYRLVEELVDTVERRAQRGPLALIVDDLQWADLSSVRTLAAAAHRVRDLPLLVVVAIRDLGLQGAGEVGIGIQTMIERGAVHLRLGPLAPPAVTALVEALAGRVSDQVQAAVEAAAGHPLSIVTLLEDRARAGTIEPGLGGAVDEVVAGRVARLPADALHVVRAAAVLGANVDIDDVLAVLEGDPFVVDRAIGELVDAHLVSHHGSRLWFRHEIVREVVLRAVPEPILRSIHRRCAAVLAARGRPSSRVARHLMAGGDDRREAVRWLRRAAADAGSRAPAAALELLREAEQLIEPDDPDRPALQMDLVAALGWCGELDECERLARALLVDRTAGVDRPALRRYLALCAFLQNRAQDAARECEQIAEEAPHPATAARARAEAALAHLAAADRARAREHAAAAVDVGVRTGSRVAQSLGRSVLSRLEAFSLGLSASLELAEDAVAIAATDPSGDASCYHPAFFRMLTLIDLDRLDEAGEEVADQRRVAERVGTAWTVPLHHGVAAVVGLFAGRLDDAAAEAAGGLDAAADVGSSLAEVWLRSVLALVAIEQGDLGAARAHLVAARAQADAQTPLLGLDLLTVAEARLEARTGAWRDAVESLAAAREVFTALEMPSCLGLIASDLVPLARRTGAAHHAEAAAADLELIAARTGLARDEGAARCARGLLDRDPVVLLEGLDLLRRAPRPLLRAQWGEGAAVALWEAGRRDEAAEVLAESEQSYADAGAAGSARRVAQLFPALGLRRPRSRRTVDAAPRLTAREATIADLAAAGLSNQEIADQLGISKRTVETHLNRVYAKLGIDSRLQLVLERQRAVG